jgi:hypothetical protein
MTMKDSMRTAVRGGTTMQTHTIKITGLSEETLRRLDLRARSQGEDRSDHVRKLIEKDLAQEEVRLTGKSFDEALSAIRQGFAESGLREEEALSLLTEGLNASRKERRARQAENV